MNRLLVALILALFFSFVGIRNTEADIASVETFVKALSERTTPVPPDTLNEMARMTYEMLLNVPFAGIHDSQRNIDALIVFRHALEVQGRIAERILALRIQEGIDRMLLFEVYQKTLVQLGRTVLPTHQNNSLVSETVMALLKRNAIDAEKYIKSIRTLDGAFANFCRSKNFSTEDFLTGRVVQALPFDMQLLMQDMLSFPGGRLKKGEKGATEDDLLFVLTLRVIDQAIDARILCDVFLSDLPVSRESYLQQIEQRLTLQPNMRVMDGIYNTPDKVDATWSQYRGEGIASDEYLILLTYLFLPYLRASNVGHAKFDEIFFHYTGKQKQFSAFWGL